MVLLIVIVANLPAEIAHLYEEAGAKQTIIDSLNKTIANKDGQLQKFVKQHGALAKHPKEEQLYKEISDAYAKAQSLQDQKIALVQKACHLLDRYVKRLDVKIRDLQNDGAMPIDNRMPSLLRNSEGNLVPIDSNQSTGTNTPNPLQPVSGNPQNYSFNHPTMARLAQSAAANRGHPPAAAPHPLQQSQSASTATPASSANPARPRDASVPSDPKKRRLNLGTLPTPNLTTRHSSLGPNTPKATTPGASRAGSVGPRPGIKKATTLRKPLQQQILKQKKNTKNPKKAQRRLLTGSRASPSTTTGDELSQADSGSEDGDFGSQDGKSNGKDGMEDASDDTKYCYCQDVSHGDMVACDNADCKSQWFHWTCVGITSEPVGEWLCKECRKLPKDKIKKQEASSAG